MKSTNIFLKKMEFEIVFSVHSVSGRLRKNPVESIGLWSKVSCSLFPCFCDLIDTPTIFVHVENNGFVFCVIFTLVGGNTTLHGTGTAWGGHLPQCGLVSSCGYLRVRPGAVGDYVADAGDAGWPGRRVQTAPGGGARCVAHQRGHPDGGGAETAPAHAQAGLEDWSGMFFF